jgi:hypothetical protein
MNYTIVFSILSVIAIVGLIFSFTMSSYIQIYDSDWNGIFSDQEIQENSKKRIFIIGSSSVYSVNATQINDQLSSNNLNYEIFNLADMSDSPTKRIQSIKNIIANEPEIVIYGLGAWEFKKKSSSEPDLQELILNPKSFFLYTFEDVMQPIRENIPGSPKDRSLLTAKYLLFGPEQKYHPFINFYKTPITPIKQIKTEWGNPKLTGLDLSTESVQLNSLKNLILEFKKNDIKLIIFTNPYQKISVNNEGISDFKKMLEGFSDEYEVPVYFLHDNYFEMEIWRDNVHVAVHEDAQIFTHDVLKIIIQELKANVI